MGKGGKTCKPCRGLCQRLRHLTGQAVKIDAAFLFDDANDGFEHELDCIHIMEDVIESPALERALEFRNGSASWMLFLRMPWYTFSGYVFILAMVFYLHAAMEWYAYRFP